MFYSKLNLVSKKAVVDIKAAAETMRKPIRKKLIKQKLKERK